MNTINTAHYRERIIAGLPKLLMLTAFLTFLSGIIIPFSAKSQLSALLVWGISWAFTYQLLYAVDALEYNKDHPLWHQKEGLRKIRLWLSVILYNIALFTEVGRVLDKLPLPFLKTYDSHSGTLCLAGLSWLIYWLGNVAQPSMAQIRSERIEASVHAMRSDKCDIHPAVPSELAAKKDIIAPLLPHRSIRSRHHAARRRRRAKNKI